MIKLIKLTSTKSMTTVKKINSTINSTMLIIISQNLTDSQITDINMTEKKHAITVIKKVMKDLIASMKSMSHNLINKKRFMNLKFDITSSKIISKTRLLFHLIITMLI